MKKIIAFFLGIIAFSFSSSQSVAINNDGSPAHASAILDIKSTDKGLLIPRVSLASDSDIVTISNPRLSLLIYNSNAALPYGVGYYYWTGNLWSKFATRTNLDNLAWGVSGNAGTNATTDFIGTTDNKALVFKTNNILSGKIDAGSNNVFFGRSAGELTTGVNNTFFGHQAGSENTSGIQNTAIGSFSLDSNTTGNNNTAAGLSALRSNSTGDENTGLGSRALFSNKSGSRNIAIGRQSLLSGVDATDCVVIGNNALSSLTTAIGSVVIGSGALQNATTSVRTIGIGYNALLNNTGLNNVAIGYEALKANTSGGQNIGIGESTLIANTSGSDNVAVGRSSLLHNLLGNSNIAIGNSSLFTNTNGNDNTGIGDAALLGNTTGSNNTAIGNIALFNNTTGVNNTALGADAFATSGNGNLNNTTMIGYEASVSTSNTMTFGNSSVDRWAFGISTTTANHAMEVGSNSGNGNGAYLTQGGTWTNTSSRMRKEDFSDINGPELLQKIKQMPVQRWKYKGTNEYHIGPMAEDFYKLFGLGTDDKGISTVDPAGIALAAIQEQQKIIEKQNELIQQLRKRIEALEKK